MKTKNRIPCLPVLAVCLLGAVVLAGGCCRKAETVELFNGKDLSGWKVVSQEKKAESVATWTVKDGVIHDSGFPMGYLRTEGRYADYKLEVEWRWLTEPLLDAKGKPRLGNGGILLHMQGVDEVWPKSLEAQMRQTDAGDFFVIGGVTTKEYLEQQEKALAAAGDDEKARKKVMDNRRIVKKRESSEKAIGEWNKYEVICKGDTVTLIVNGVEQNRTTGVSVKEGHICLQSERAPMQIRSVRLTPLK